MEETGDRSRQVIVDITVAAPIEAVWRALRDPALIRTWFGWDAPTLDDEIKFIFLDNATADAATHTLQFGEWEGVSDAIALEPREDWTQLRVFRNGGSPIDWAGAYNDVPEGWVTFFEQLRLALERHPEESRRTIYLSGAARPGVDEPLAELGLAGIGRERGEPYAVRLATGDEAAGMVWYTTHFQTGLTVDQWGDGLIAITNMGPSPKRPHGGGSVLITTYDLSEAEFAALEARWRTWWSARYEPPSA